MKSYQHLIVETPPKVTTFSTRMGTEIEIDRVTDSNVIITVNSKSLVGMFPASVREFANGLTNWCDREGV